MDGDPMTHTDWPDLTQVDRAPDGLPPKRRRDWKKVEAHLNALPAGQWALVEVARNASRADGIRKVLLRHSRVEVTQRLRDDGTYLVFGRIRQEAK